MGVCGVVVVVRVFVLGSSNLRVNQLGVHQCTGLFTVGRDRLVITHLLCLFRRSQFDVLGFLGALSDLAQS